VPPKKEEGKMIQSYYFSLKEKFLKIRCIAQIKYTN
jgi:hypothetical protein